MPNPFRDLFFGRRPPVRAEVPGHTFADVVLAPHTRRQLEQALAQIRKQTLIFGDWGLAERHGGAVGLAFNFAGPPGTGKTICAQAVANALGRPLLVVRYDELESMWAGETGRNVAAVFRAADEQGAVLFFDEADAIAGRRFSSTRHGYEREANTVVNILLRELEQFSGVVIFATNLAANFDPAFERRIRSHVRFEMPGPEEREQIWRVQLHPERTPLADDVNFHTLAERYEVSGGDIRNAVLNAALAATLEPGPDAEKRIAQRHFEQGVEEVVAARDTMQQSVFGADDGNPWGGGEHFAALLRGQEMTEENLSTLAGRLVQVEDQVGEIPEALGRVAEALQQERERTDLALRSAETHRAKGDRIALWAAAAALLAAAGALAAALL